MDQSTLSVAEKEAPNRLDDVITILEMSRRLGISTETAYQLAARPGFPLYNITGGERGNKTIWGDALDWVRQNCRVGS